jgi:tripartite-type tricarboxylate transporter receptor subunit TctC
MRFSEGAAMPRFARLYRLFAPFAVILASSAAIFPAVAQGWPDRPFTMVVPYAPGGSTDLIARLVAPKLSQALGQPVLVENMPGIGGIAGVSRVAKAAPDGYQFVVGNVGTHAQNQFLFKYPPYDAAAEFVPIALLVDQTMVLTSRPDLPAGGLTDFIAHLRSNQQTMKYASAGFGSPTHLACALLNAALGVDIRHVPYRGGSPASRDLMAGKVDYFCSNLAAIKHHIEAGRLKAPAMLSRARARSLQDIPTAQEQGLKNFEATNWLGLFLPIAVPEGIVERLNAAVVRTLADQDLHDRLRALDAEPVAAERNTPERLLCFLAEERAKWGAVIRSASIKLE